MCSSETLKPSRSSAKVDTLVVDKTGTLTEGKPKLVSVTPVPGVDEQALLRLAASLERGSEHPLAAAIVKGAKARGLALANADGFESITGKGVKGRIDGRGVSLGNRALMEILGIDAGALVERAEALRAEGQTVMFVAIDGTLGGLVGVADPIKDSTPDAIRTLHEEGVRLVMLTGDSRTTGTRRREKAGDRRRDGRGAARSEGRQGQAPAGRGPRRRDGGRRDQRRARAGPGTSGCGHGHRDRCGDGERGG